LCHQDSYKLKLGSNHSDVYPWFKKHGKTMDDVRNDVATLMNGGTPVPTPTPAATRSIIYKTFDDTKNVWLPDVTNDEDYAGIFGHPVTGVYANLTSGDCIYKVHTNGGKWLPEVKNREDYAGILDKPIDGFMIKGDGKIHYQVHIKGGNWLPYVTGYDVNDDDNGYAGIFGKTIDAVRMYVEEEKTKAPVVTTPTPVVPEVKVEEGKKPVSTPVVEPEVNVEEPKVEESNTTPTLSPVEPELKTETSIPDVDSEAILIDSNAENLGDVDNVQNGNVIFNFIAKIIKAILNIFIKNK
jgi:hypothetical protein